MEHTYNTIEEAMQQHEDILRELRKLRRTCTILDWMCGTQRYKRLVIVNCLHVEMKGILYDFAFGIFPINLETQINNILNPQIK
jgi:hypothetical protein